MFFFFKQKTAYEMRISDWSSDVCSSDLQPKLDNALKDSQALRSLRSKRLEGRGRPAKPGNESGMGWRVEVEVRRCRRLTQQLAHLAASRVDVGDAALASQRHQTALTLLALDVVAVVPGGGKERKGVE